MFSTAMLDAMYRHEPLATYFPPGSEAAASTAHAKFCAPSADAFAGDVLSSDPSLRYPLHSFPNVVRDGIFLINAERWRVRQAPQKILDGQQAVCLLESES